MFASGRGSISIVQKCMMRQMCSTTEKVVTKPTWQKYMLRSTIVVVGVPAVIAGGFIYNLKTDDEFKFHFEEKYPDLIHSLRKYVELEDPDVEIEDEVIRTRPYAPTNVSAIVTMKSGRRFRLHLKSNIGIDQVTAAAQTHGAAKDDSVVDIIFEDSTVVAEDDNTSSSIVEKQEDTAAAELEQEIPVSTWPEKRPVRQKVSAEAKAEWELIAVRGQIDALEKEKRTGTREIDTIDEEIQVLIQKEKEIQKLLPRKKWFGLF